MKGIRIVAMVCVLCIFSSCGSLRNKSRSSGKLEIKEGAKVEQTIKEQSGSKSVVQDREIDKGTVVTERQTATTTITEGSKGKAVIRKGDLKPGENIIPMDSAVGMIKAVLDTLNKTLTLEVTTPSSKKETVVNEKITERKDVEKERKEERQDTSSKQVAVQAEQNRRETSQTSQSTSTPNIWAVFASKIGWAIAFLVILIGVCWWFFGIGRRK